MSEKSINVLQVFGSLNVGGAECRMMDVYRNIDLSEIQFDFVTLTSGSQFFENEIASLGGHIYRVSSPRETGILSHIKDLRQCMKNGNYAAVHAHTSYHCGLVMLAGWLEHIPVRISHARTTGSKRSTKSTGFAVLLGRFLIGLFSTKRLAISRSAGEYVFGKRSFEVLPNAIDVKKYQNLSDEELCTIKQEYGIASTAFVIGQIGRFEPMKNHVFTIRWFNRFVKSNPNSVLMLIGDGPQKSNIEKLCDEMDIRERVIFTGIRNDVNRLIHTFDVLLFPSVFEGLGGVAIEAQAAGIPVVESDSVPEETDLSIGLVQRISLQNDFSVWDQAVLNSQIDKCISKEVINSALSEKGYMLSAAIDRLSKVYQGEK